jgi:hypothetical protein
MIHGMGSFGAECETASTLGETQYELQNHLVHVPSNVLRVGRARISTLERGPCFLHNLVTGTVNCFGGCHRCVNIGTFHRPEPTATGKKTEGRGISVFRIVDGRLKEEWTEFSQLLVLRQLGLLPGRQ